MRRLVLLLAVLALTLAAGCGDDKKDSRDSSAVGGGQAATTTEQPAAEEPGAGCEKAAEPKPKEDGGQKKPKEKLDPAKSYRLKVDTNCGSFTITLDPKQSPNATASLVSLARARFFDGTVFHRIVPDFVIQGGDPTASGTGGPGYSTRDIPPGNASYTKGVVAMAKAGQEAPGTAGSQFYVVTGADAGLPPDYAIVGKVSEGQDVVDRIGQLGGPDEQPTQTVVIRSVVAEEG